MLNYVSVVNATKEINANIFHFYSNDVKTSGFLTFSGVMEKYQWHKIG